MKTTLHEHVCALISGTAQRILLGSISTLIIAATTPLPSMAAETELFYTQFINRTNNTGRSATDYEIKIGTGKMVTFRLDEGDFAFNAGTLPASDLRLFNSVVTNGASIGFTIAYEGFNGASFTSNWSAINQTTGLEENSGNDITIGQTNNDSASLPNGTSSPVMTFINPSAICWLRSGSLTPRMLTGAPSSCRPRGASHSGLRAFRHCLW